MFGIKKMLINGCGINGDPSSALQVLSVWEEISGQIARANKDCGVTVAESLLLVGLSLSSMKKDLNPSWGGCCEHPGLESRNASLCVCLWARGLNRNRGIYRGLCESRHEHL